MPSTVQRRIRHARLRCARPEHAAHGRVLLEDALRTASLPDQGRLVVFRRVDLGRLSPHSSAGAWSRRLELRLLQLASRAVYFAEPAAARAEAVWFPDAWEAPIELAVRWQRGAVPAAWFWPVAVPGWSAGLPPVAAARLLFRTLEARGGDAATLALAARLARADRLIEYAECLSATELRAWTPRAAGGPAPASPAARLPEAELDPMLPVPWRVRLAGLKRTWSATPARFCWVLAGVLAAGRDAGHEPELLRCAAELWWRRAIPDEPAALPARTPPPEAARAVAAPAARAAVSPPAPGTAATTPNAPPAGDRDSAAARASATAAGGLLFTLHLLHALGWPGSPDPADRAAAAQQAGNWWRHLAERLALPPGDAIRRWLETWCERVAPAAPVKESPFTARRAAARRLDRRLHAGSAPRLSDPAALTLAVQRLCWRRARLGWRPLVRRPAQMTWTNTHVDLCFTHRQADVRVRRAGLDLDPGWVPWLGRVVRFHYVEVLPA
jgi:hypothetical protein